MAKISVSTLDLNFQNHHESIGAYLIPHRNGAALVEAGPGSTIHTLETCLFQHGFRLQDITHIFLTHIHLDHAGAAGFLARQGAQVYVHPAGAPHIRDPQRLIASAMRIYGEKMHTLWGEFLPVPSENLVEVQDGQEIAIGGLHFISLFTPGHAEHHIAWVLEDICFTGDIAGVRLPGCSYVRLPLVPPELHIERWRDSLNKIEKTKVKRLAPTHFGIFAEVQFHLMTVSQILETSERWIETEILSDPVKEDLREKYTTWMREQGLSAGLSASQLETYQIANPTWMSADGLQRYWHKFRMPQSGIPQRILHSH